MFAGTARSLPKSVSTERGYFLVGSGQKARPEKIAKQKHSSLFQKLVNYSRKKSYNIGPSLILFSPMKWDAAIFFSLILKI